MSDYLNSVLKEYGVAGEKNSEPDYLKEVLGEYGITEKPAPKTRNPFAVANDTVITAANAALGGVQAASDFVSPGNRLSQGIEGLIKEGEEKQSDIVKAGRAKLNQAMESEDIGTQLKGVKEYVTQNPLQAAAMGAGSFALPLGAIKGVKYGSAALGLGEKLAGRLATGTGMLTSGVMAGGDAAGSAYQEVMNSPNLQHLPVEERETMATDAARKASVVPFAIGAASGMFGAEKALATGTKSILKTGLQEFGSEALEEGVTQLSSNLAAQQYAPEVGTWKGVAGAAALGGVLGGGTGLAVGMVHKQPDSLLPGSTNISTGEPNPDSNAINKAIDANSSEIPVGPPPREALIGPQSPEQVGPPAPSQQQVEAAQQQIAAQKQQEAQEAFNHVASTYGITPTGTGSFKLGGALIRDQGIAQQYIQGFEAINKDKTPEQKAIFGAALSSGAAKVKPGSSIKSIAQAANNFLTQWQFEGLNTKQEAADWADQQIAAIEGSSAIKEAAPLNEFHRSLTGQDSPAFVTLVQQAEEKPTKQTKEGVTNGQLQLQSNAGLREVPVQGGTTETSGTGTGNVRPVSIQPVGAGSLGEGSLGLQTGAIPSGGVSTSTAANVAGTTVSSGQQEQAQQVINDDRVFAINEIEKMAIAAFGARDAKIIMEFIATDGAVNKAQIAERLGLSRARITQITGAPQEGETFNEQIERMAAEKWGPKLFIEGKRMGYSKEDMLALFETTAKAQDEMVAETGETVNDQESEVTAAPPTEEIYNTNADDVNIATSDEANYGTSIGNEELATSDEDGGQTASGYRIFNPKVSGTSELEDASAKNRAKFSKKDISAMSDSQLQNLAADEETSAEKVLQIAEELTKRQQKRVGKGEPNAVQKPSPEKKAVGNKPTVSERIRKQNAEKRQAAPARKAEENVGKTPEEIASKAWDEGIKDFPDAPKFSELTAEQQADWVSYGEENWTKEDVQTELIKLAKTQFSKNEIAEGSTKEEIEKDLGTFIGLGKSRVIKIVQSVSDLPTRLQNALSDQESVAGFVTKFGTAYLIADNIEKGNARAVFMHEVGSHLGLQNLLSDTDIDTLIDQITNWSENSKTLEGKIAIAALKRVAAAKTSKAQYNTELLAYFIEEAISAGVNPTAGDYKTQLGRWFAKVVSAFRSALAKLDIKGSQLAAQDLVDLAYGAAHIALQENKAQFQKTGKTQFAFAGQKATQAAAKISDLVTARLMESQGLSENEIWKTTGWSKGADGKWRFEINDENAKLRGLHGESGTALESIKPDSSYDWTLSDVLDFPELFAAYPELADVKITRKNGFMDFFGSQQGWFNELTNVINITQNAKDPLSTLLHEVQHWIQSKEGFAPGGNEESTRPDNKEALLKAKDHVSEILNQKYSELTSLTFKGIAEGKAALTTSVKKLEGIVEAIDALLGVNKELSDLFKAWDNTKSVSNLYDFKLKQISKQMETAKPKEWLQLSDERSKIYKEINNTDRIAKQTKDKIADLIKQTTKKASDVQYVLYQILAGEVEARDVQGRMKLTAEERQQIAPGATTQVQKKNQIVLKEPSVSFSIASKPLKKARETTAKRIEKLPPTIRTPLQHLMSNVFNFAKKGLPYFSFTEDLVDLAAKYIPSARAYVNASKAQDALKTKFEVRVDKILKAYDSLPSSVKGTGENSVNRFLKDSTMSGKWAYNPGWIKNFDEAKSIDPELKARFDAMPEAAQAMIKSVFEHGYNSLKEMQKSVMETITTDFDALIDAAQKAGETEEVQKLTKSKIESLTDYRTLMRTNSTTPYAPLKRFGNYVVVGYSQQYLDNLEIVEDKTSAPDVKAEAKKKLRELEKNEDHYFVQFAETAGEADAVVREEAGNYAHVENFEKDTSNRFGGRDLQSAFHRLKNMVEDTASTGVSDASERAVNRLLADLHLTLLSEQSARQSERRRRKIHGAEDDMMRAFATQGRATAHFIASLSHSQEIYDSLKAMKAEADAKTPGAATTRGERRRYYNEFVKRHYMGLDYTPSPFTDKALSVTSAWMLLTNPAYYLQNMTQPFMMSLPVVAGKHGYAKSWKEFTRAYKDIATGIRKNGLGEDTYEHLPEDVRKVVEELVNRGRIDISLEQDLGRWRSAEDSKLAKFGQASEKLRSVAQYIETINRVATAVAAYRLEIKTSNPTRALNYADKVIYTTHGDYSGFNAPRIARSSLGRLATQFRKFQLIQISLMARLFNDAFASSDPETKLIGRKALMYTLSHTAVMGGIMGLPGFMALAALYGMLFGDPDEPDNPELALRQAIGDDTLADLILKGAPAAAGVDVSGKLGMGQMLSVLPYTDVSLSRKGVYETIGTLVSGPFGGLLAKSADGASYIAQGDYYKGMEQLLPTGLGNAMKGYRYGTEGITSKTGDVTMSPDEIGTMDAFMVALGLPTKPITDRQFLQSAKFEYDQFYNERATEIKREYVRAYKEGDNIARLEAMDEWKKLQESRSQNGYTRQPLSTLIKAPQEQRKRERMTVGGVAYNKSNRGFVKRTSEL